MAGYDNISAWATIAPGGIPIIDLVNDTVVAVGVASSTPSALLTSPFLVLVSDTDCWVTFDATTPVAVAGAVHNFPVYANSPVSLCLPTYLKIAAIRSSADGNLHVYPAKMVGP